MKFSVTFKEHPIQTCISLLTIHTILAVCFNLVTALLRAILIAQAHPPEIILELLWFLVKMVVRMVV